MLEGTYDKHVRTPYTVGMGVVGTVHLDRDGVVGVSTPRPGDCGIALRFDDLSTVVGCSVLAKTV